MLLRIFRANYFYNYLLFPIVGALLLLKSFLAPNVFLSENITLINPMFQQLYDWNISSQTALVLNFIAVMIICLQLLLINATFSFVRERTFLPLYLFMFIALSQPTLHTLQPVFIAAIFLLLALYNIFLSFEKKKVIVNGFNAGFFTGIAGLFYPALNVLIFLVPISLYILKNKIGWREWIASFLGLTLPHLYVFTYFFFTKNLSSFTHIYTNLFIFKDLSFFIQLPVIVHYAVITIITIAASAFILKGFDENKISTRGFFKILSYYFYVSLLLILVPSVSYELIVIVSIPLTFLLTNYFTFMKRRFWAELFFILLIIFAVVLQFWMR